MKYIVIKAKSLDELEKYVNNHLAQGFIPQGGICESGNDSLLFFQAMIKK